VLPEIEEVIEAAQDVMAHRNERVDLVRMCELVCTFDDLDMREWRWRASKTAEICILEAAQGK
jgi:hypothetical protein